MADQSKNKWFPWRRLLRSTQTPRPETREVAVSQVTDKYSEYPSDGLTPVRLAEIFKEADAGDVLRQAERRRTEQRRRRRQHEPQHRAEHRSATVALLPPQDRIFLRFHP